MTDQVESVLWCSDCMTKHARDLLHHAEARGDSELKYLAEKAFGIASDMQGVKDKHLYSEIRDLEHHAEDLITGLRTERKKLSGCQSCSGIQNSISAAKSLNTMSPQYSNIKTGGFLMDKEDLIQVAAGSFGGKAASVVTPMVVPAGAIVPGVSNKTLANIVIGGALTGLALYGKLGKYSLAGAVAGTSLIANEVVDLAMGMVPAGAVYTPPAAAVAVKMAPANLYGTSFGAGGPSNGSLVYID